MHNQTLSKQLYKVFLICIRYTPIVLSINFISGLVCIYHNINIPIFSYFGGVSFIFLGLLYLISWVFQFCHLYRIPLHHVTICNVLGLIHQCSNYMIDVITVYRIYSIITGITALLYVWFVYKNQDRKTIQHIKKLVDSLCPY
jgi:hypothetical protein